MSPVVPVAHAGAHETFLVLSDGRRLAEAMRLPAIARAHIWPIHLSLPWGIGFGPLPHIPIPATLRYRFGEPVHPQDVGWAPGERVNEEHVRAFDRLVRQRIQRELNRLRDER